MSRRSTYEILKATKARIKNPKNWCKGKFRIGRRYCAIGALNAERGLYDSYIRDNAYEYLVYASAQLGYGDSVTIANDVAGHKAVMKIYDRAIRNAKRRHIEG